MTTGPEIYCHRLPRRKGQLRLTLLQLPRVVSRILLLRSSTSSRLGIDQSVLGRNEKSVLHLVRRLGNGFDLVGALRVCGEAIFSEEGILTVRWRGLIAPASERDTLEPKYT
jgi:hypothetical protein